LSCQLIKAIDLAAASRRQARYYLRRYELPHGSGYVISKLSGPVGQEKAAEEWYRPTLSMAEKKYSVKTRIVVPPTLSDTEGRQLAQNPTSIRGSKRGPP
jgi:hypothetical protein